MGCEMRDFFFRLGFDCGWKSCKTCPFATQTTRIAELTERVEGLEKERDEAKGEVCELLSHIRGGSMSDESMLRYYDERWARYSKEALPSFEDIRGMLSNKPEALSTKGGK